MKTIAPLTAALIAFGFGTTALAAEAPLPPTYIVHKLVADGVDLRSLEMEDGIYEARVATADNTLVKVGVDPQTAELTDAYSHARAKRADTPAPKASAADAIQAVAATGHWDVREVEFENGAWKIEARDDSGRKGKFTVDAATGSVR